MRAARLKRPPIKAPLRLGFRSVNARSMSIGSTAIGVYAVAALAVGAFAMGALSVGVLVLGRVSIGHLRLNRGEIDSLRLGDVTVRRFKVESGDRIEGLSDLPVQGR